LEGHYSILSINWLIWKVGDGEIVHIGVGPWVGSGHTYNILGRLFDTLHGKGIFIIALLPYQTIPPSSINNGKWQTLYI